jgi:hypothetical protein
MNLAGNFFFFYKKFIFHLFWFFIIQFFAYELLVSFFFSLTSHFHFGTNEKFWAVIDDNNQSSWFYEKANTLLL